MADALILKNAYLSVMNTMKQTVAWPLVVVATTFATSARNVEAPRLEETTARRKPTRRHATAILTLSEIVIYAQTMEASSPACALSAPRS